MTYHWPEQTARAWSDEHMSILRQMHIDGLRAREIAPRVGRSIKAVNAKRNRMGLYLLSQRTLIRIDAIQRATAEAFGITVDELLSVRRLRKFARPRQAAMYLARTLSRHSFLLIGQKFHRDHSTVIHACEMIDELRTRDAELAGTLEEIEWGLLP